MTKDFESHIENLFRRLYAPLVAYGNKFVQDPEIAKEIVQEVFANLWEKGNSLQIKTSEEAYLYTAVRNRSINHLKAQVRNLDRSVALMDVHTSVDDLEVQHMESMELAKIIKAAIESLSQKTQIIFTLSREEELSYKEISEKLEISIKTVEFHISSALKTIRSFLEKYWYLPVLLIATLRF
ncbi:RNA polymerase sigma-70 factor [Fulvivirgaceae bacterium BMA10]|uniref:RNA polymerase sigma-70 factor n=1 Tax=Splendidivirga corallicola TaxID=3051826 RepID=A0ABT8KJE0_9BACT|nr:RNA polymerase sigma-70 factor [Fulvivirgaceae bacterium BMA10]